MKDIIHKAPKAKTMMDSEKLHVHNRKCKIP